MPLSKQSGADQPRDRQRRGLPYGRTRRRNPAANTDSSKATSSSDNPWIVRWATVVAAVITALAAIAVGLLNIYQTNHSGQIATTPKAIDVNSPCQNGILSVTSVILSQGDPARKIGVEGQWTGLPLGRFYNIYAIARAVNEDSKGAIEPGLANRSWYVSEPAKFDNNGRWSASISIDFSEKRALVVQALCTNYCYVGSLCAFPAGKEEQRTSLLHKGPDSEYVEKVTPGITVSTIPQ